MFDAHTHLQDPRFDACREAAVTAAATAGLTGTCCCGTAPGDWERVETVAARAWNAEGTPPHATPGITTSAFPIPPAVFLILPAFGVHPWHAADLPDDWLERLEAFLHRHPHAPVGETGIDGIRDPPPHDVQRRVLAAQLDLAARLQRPVVLHGARAWNALVDLVRPVARRLPGFLAHGFAGSAEVLRDLLALGGSVSFAGTVCNPAAARTRSAAAAVPADRLLIETDAPDMLPWPLTARREPEDGTRSAEVGTKGETPPAERANVRFSIPTLNQPAHLVHVAQAVAELRGAAIAEIAAVTTANARRLFRLNPEP